jgi:hypothetical protein
MQSFCSIPEVQKKLVDFDGLAKNTHFGVIIPFKTPY